MFALASILAALPLLAQAKFTIKLPDGNGWLGNSTVAITWDADPTDPPFSVELGNTQIKDGLLGQGPIAVANNVAPTAGSIQFQLPTLPADPHYFIVFVAIADVNLVYANSTLFPIRANPLSTQPPTSTTQLSRSSTKLPLSSTKPASSGRPRSSVPPSSTGPVVSNSNSVPRSSSTSESITSLVITQLPPSSTPSGKPNGAAPSFVSGMPVSVVALGAVILGAFVAI